MIEVPSALYVLAEKSAGILTGHPLYGILLSLAQKTFDSSIMFLFELILVKE